ncbi:hypothetical protein GGTG_13420 [Gaeumannomyces tritici R3-111a-1]|uniref:Uncharacterized protein n=1 Tax=Gaeumannomyces tritici (strain R3-111a-1) TaxID=644352 RepID=J3PIU0_GAET3|nr:hypothetical protein GGTG_13420 [Gaeumannomyces tritici R3-111a-1]EJT69023.1 hypothetical protein GGTG_13420 [Gaeumannomyces tritici R3-111a-1]
MPGSHQDGGIAGHLLRGPASFTPFKPLIAGFTLPAVRMRNWRRGPARDTAGDNIRLGRNLWDLIWIMPSVNANYDSLWLGLFCVSYYSLPYRKMDIVSFLFGISGAAAQPFIGAIIRCGRISCRKLDVIGNAFSSAWFFQKPSPGKRRSASSIMLQRLEGTYHSTIAYIRTLRVVALDTTTFPIALV